MRERYDGPRAVPPGEREVLAAGPRRTLPRRAAVAVVAVGLLALATAVGVLLTRAGSPARRTPGSPPSAAQVVDGPGARLVRVAVAATDPRVRAGVWRRCARPGCAASWLVVAVTTDGFVHRSLAGPWPVDDAEVSVAGSGRALVHPAGVPAFLLDLDGTRRALPAPASRAAPLRADELLTGTLAVDPVTGAAHRVPVPAGVRGLVRATGSRLAGTRDGALLASEDGGRTWRRISLPAGGVAATVLPSARPDVLVALRGRQGDSSLRFEQAVRFGQRRVRVVPQRPGPRAFVDGGVLLPDGRLVVDVVAWSTGHVGAVGPFISRDWRTWRPLVPGATGRWTGFRVR